MTSTGALSNLDVSQQLHNAPPTQAHPDYRGRSVMKRKLRHRITEAEIHIYRIKPEGLMVLCLWVRWSDYKPSVIYVSVCSHSGEIRDEQPDGTLAGGGGQ